MLPAIFLFLQFSIFSQITLTSATFPKAGDTLRYATDASPSGINPATPPGGNQVWDFSSLNAGSKNDDIFLAAATGLNNTAFAGADLLIKGAIGTESYYNVTNNKVEIMGFAGALQDFFNLKVIARYSPAVVEWRAPTNFFDINQQSSNLTLPFSVKDLPAAVFAAVPIKPDSVRLSIKISRLDVVDGWGSCKIPGGQFQVLRQKRTVYTTTNLDVKVPPLGWFDVSQLAGSGLSNLVGTDTTVTYHFLNNSTKEEIAAITMNNQLSAAVSARFKYLKTTPVEDVLDFAPGTANIQAFPNPAVEYVRFNCSNLPQGRYTLKIFNIIGRVVWRDNYDINGTRSILVDLDKFKKGTYLYSLIDQKGNTIGTKRLVVLKP
jgi:Secretion system C-terminal sorting domain